MKSLFLSRLLVATSMFVVAASTTSAQPSAPSRLDTGVVASRRGVVVSVSGIASDVGASILKRGGNAVDAAVATAFALAVTHPSAGNLGGGGFMVVRTADGKATSFDYRERAPAASTQTMYLKPDGTIDRSLTRAGWLAPGVPGTVRGLAMDAGRRAFGLLARAYVPPRCSQPAGLAAKDLRLCVRRRGPDDPPLPCLREGIGQVVEPSALRRVGDPIGDRDTRPRR